ncbi:LysM peptidoglycan-binding domain-containing protein [Azohydromonas caseinilytica]|uniref:LysM peptidoglycan-binding domain-containing protein n=1 Tax=Azohydromonas caseinilytica TaxID=2728836 RepID=A0A848FJ08_9BURK|nr:LysM peptidoglycan-binding domain-containing protein [Azohydromonas caseinilytica]NML18279.1 LysM peptidoglycan-binding domain-containing protein [Azohydromonas caseinilytica]
MNSKLNLQVQAGVLWAVAAALGGCAANDPAGKPEASADAPSPVATTPAPAPQPAVLPVPGPASPAAQQQAQKMALGAVSTLEAGQEVQARAELQRALALDPQNKLAQSLLRQMSEPVITPRESFSYTVRPGDTLSSIAERFMGDKFLFYALARFNDIKVPRQLSSGQALRVPGTGQPAVVERERPAPRAQAPEPVRRPPTAVAEKPAPVTEKAGPVAEKSPPVSERHVPPAEKPAAPVPVVAPVTAPPAPAAAPPGPSPAERALLSAEAAERAGNVEKAMAEVQQVSGLEPGSPLASRQVALKKKLVGRMASNARGAFARQDLDGAIRHWDRVLQLDPGNDTARLERQRAVALKEKVGTLK